MLCTCSMLWLMLARDCRCKGLPGVMDDAQLRRLNYNILAAIRRFMLNILTSTLTPETAA